MNRLKLWVYALIVIGLAAAGLYLLAGAQRVRGIETVDRQLRAVSAHAEAAERSLTSDLAAVAALAASDVQLGAALRAGAAPSEPPAATPRARKAPATEPAPAAEPEQLERGVGQAGADAVTAAVQRMGLEPSARVVRAVSREGFERSPPGEADAAAFLAAALQGKAIRGYAVLGQKLHLGAAVPVGERGAIAVFVPADAAWLRRQVIAVAGDPGDARRRGAITLVLTAPNAGVVASAPAEAGDLAGMAARAHRATPSDSAAQLAPIDLTPAWLPTKLPGVRSLLGGLPADRVSSRALPGVKGGFMVLAASTAPALEPVVRFEWYALAGLVLAFLLAIPFSLLVKPSEVAATLPPVLLEAARKIEKGDFSARAPVLAGKLGTLAAAINKAVDAAQATAAAPVGATSVTAEFYARAPEPAADEPFSMPLRSSRAAPAEEPRATVVEPGRPDGANLSGSAFEAAPVPAAPRPSAAPAPAAAAVPVPVPTPVPAAPAASPASAAAAPASARVIVPPAASAASDLLAGAARAAPTGDGGDEEQHWREVFRDFVRTRAECGESAEGLTYERFRQKLESNKGALVAKYGCKTVRFQVYVKEGKAALKATPVR